MKKIFLLITAIILFYAGNVNADYRTCVYENDYIRIEVIVPDARPQYKFKDKYALGGKEVTEYNFANDTFADGCPNNIYYGSTIIEGESYESTPGKKFVFSTEKEENVTPYEIGLSSFIDDSTQDNIGANDDEVVPTPGGDNGTEDNSGTSDNTETLPGNGEVDVSFWGNLDVIECGSTTVPAPVPPLVRLVVMALKIVTPFVLIVMGMVDMLKAVIGSKDDEIKKEQQKFIKRVIAAVLVFFVVSILQFVVSFVAPEETDSVLRCVDCLINDASKCN